jgi:regulator of sigma E protease
MNWLYIFLGFCLLIILHEGGHFIAAKATGMRVEKFFLFIGPKIWSVKRGETEYGIAALPIGGYVKITGMNPEEEVPPEHEDRAYYRQPAWKRIVVVAAGPAVNIALAFAILFVVFFGGALQPNQTVDEIRANSPAAKVLQPGDRIVAIDGEVYAGLSREKRLERFRAQVASHKCFGKQVQGCAASTPVRLRIDRAGEMRTVSVVPEYDKAEKRTLLGLSYGAEHRDMSASAAAGEAVDQIWFVTHRTVSIFSRIFEAEKRKEISSVVGISDAANQTIEIGVYPSLFLLAVVSLSLGLINLLPILPLDGGHIFWAVFEKLRGRPASLRVMERATVIGFGLVLLLMAIGLSNDIGRLNGEGFNVR